MIELFLCLFLLLFIAHLIRNANKIRPIVYKQKKLNKTKKAFLFVKNLIFRSSFGVIFYAELSGICYLIFNKNSWVRVAFLPQCAMHPINANASFISANCSQNANAYYRIDKKHFYVNCESKIGIKISNLQFEWDSGKKHYIFDYKGKKLSLKLDGEFEIKKQTLAEFEFYGKNFGIDFSEFNFKTENQDFKQQFLRSNFGFFDTADWLNLKNFYKIYLPKDSLEKKYFLPLLDENRKVIKSLSNLNDLNFVELNFSGFLQLTSSCNLKLNLFDLGFSDLVNIKHHKTYIEILDVKTGFKSFLKFKSKIKQAYLGNVFGKMFLYVEADKRCVVEYLPFSLTFNTNLLTSSSIQRLVVNNKIHSAVLKFDQKSSFENIVSMLNFQIISNYNHYVIDYFRKINFFCLSGRIGFCVANLILSDCYVFGKSINNREIQRFLLSFLKNLNNFDKTEVYCYLQKLIFVIKNDSLRKYLFSLLTFYEKDNFLSPEYFFSYVLGIKIENKMLYVKNPKINYKIKLIIAGKTIYVESSSKNSVFVDGIEYVNKQKITLESSNQNILINYSIKS